MYLRTFALNFIFSSHSSYGFDSYSEQFNTLKVDQLEFQIQKTSLLNKSNTDIGQVEYFIKQGDYNRKILGDSRKAIEWYDKALDVSRQCWSTI